MSSEQDQDLVAKKMHVACRACERSGARSVSIIFPSERECLSEDCAPLAQYAQPRMRFGNFLVQNLWNRLSNSLSKLMFLKANSKIL